MDMLSILDSPLLEWSAVRPYGTYYTSALPSLVVGCGAAVVLGLLVCDLWRWILLQRVQLQDHHVRSGVRGLRLLQSPPRI